MKTLEFMYQETQIHFLVNPTQKNVMINATEMAKTFDKRVDVFLKSDHAKAFINILLSTPYGGNKTVLTMDEILFANKKAGTYMHRILALKFAAWLDPEFEVWVFSKIEEITFGNYKKHWEAHAMQEDAKIEMETFKNTLLVNPTLEAVQNYFEAEQKMKTAKSIKNAAIRNQLKLL